MPAIAVCQAANEALTHRYRRQASSHILQRKVLGPWGIGEDIGAHPVRIHAGVDQCVQGAVDHRRRTAGVDVHAIEVRNVFAHRWWR